MTTPSMTLTLALTGLFTLSALVLTPSEIHAARPACPAGRFVVERAPLAVGPLAPPATGVNVFPRPATVAVGSTCAPVSTRLSGRTVRAVWTCEGLPGSVRLRGRLSRDCGMLKGVLKAKRIKRRFSARRAAPAGERFQGDPGTSLAAALRDVDASPPHPPEEIGIDAGGVAVARTALEMALAPDATVGQANAVLDLLGGGVVSMLAGVPVVVVRFPDPGSVAALDTLRAAVEAAPGVRYVNLAHIAGPDALPANYTAPLAADALARLDHLLAVRAPGAWNARRALQPAARPLVVVADVFGAGPPDPSVVDYDPPPPDFGFASGNPSSAASILAANHGYLVFGLLAASFGGPSTAAGLATGIFPTTTRVAVFDIQGPTGTFDLPTIGDEILRAVRADGGPAVVNTSLGFACVAPPECGTSEAARLTAHFTGLAWIEKVRAGGLENRFLHIASAGNVPNNPVTTAETNSPWCAAALLDGLPNLTNTLVVENALPRAEPPFGARCLNLSSHVRGHLAAIGSDVYSFAGPASPLLEIADGGTSSAAPQAAGLAAYLWAIAPTLAPQELAGLLLTTSSPGALEAGNARCYDTTPSAPVIDAYGAVLALDEAALPTPATAPVRFAILDVDDDGSFDDDDLFELVTMLIDSTTDLPREPGDPAFDRADLNGDGFTSGASRRAPFDLDRVDSTQYGPSQLGRVTQQIEGLPIPFEETALTDLDILCYYAYSDLFEGTAAERRVLLPPERCARFTLNASFPSTISPGVQELLHVSVGVETPSGSAPLAGVHLELVASGGTVAPTSGITDAAGEFGALASVAANSSEIVITIRARTEPGGDVLAETSVQAAASSPVDCTSPSAFVGLLLSVTFVDTEHVFGDADATLTDSVDRPDRRVAAEVSMGFGHVTAELDEGTFRPEGEGAGAVGNFQDVFVVTPADPALIGTGGTITARVEVTASGSASGEDGFSLWRLHVVPQQIVRSGRFTQAGYTGDAPGTYDVPLGIVFGTESLANFNVSGSANAASVGGRPSRGGGQIDVTFRFLGYGEARDAAGNPVAFSLCTNVPPPITTTTSSTTSSTSTSTTTSTTTTLPGTERDPYRVYGATGPDGPSVTLTDELRTETVDLGSVLFFLTPAGIDGTPFLEQTIAQACYDHPGAPFAGTAEVVHRLGSESLAVGDPLALCVPSEATGIAVNPYACYAATGDSLAEPHTLADDFQAQAVQVLEPFLVCVPVAVDGAGVVNASEYLTCYLTDPAGTAAGPVGITNVFHTDTLDVGGPVGLCVPSLALVSPAGP
jgi:hypothetical protein